MTHLEDVRSARNRTCGIASTYHWSQKELNFRAKKTPTDKIPSNYGETNYVCTPTSVNSDSLWTPIRNSPKQSSSGTVSTSWTLCMRLPGTRTASSSGRCCRRSIRSDAGTLPVRGPAGALEASTRIEPSWRTSENLNGCQQYWYCESSRSGDCDCEKNTVALTCTNFWPERPCTSYREHYGR